MRGAKKLIFLALWLVLPLLASAQQWSSDPWVDHLKQMEADLIKSQEFMNWCEQPANRHADKCSGVNVDEATHIKFITWDEAMKLADEKATPAKPVSLGESARQFRIEKLQKRLEPLVADFCKKNPTTKVCSLATAPQIARRLAEKDGGYDENLIDASQEEVNISAGSVPKLPAAAETTPSDGDVPSTPKTPAAGTLFLWVDSYVRQDRAQDAEKQIVGLGMPAGVIPKHGPNGDFYIVYSGPYPNEQIASAMQKIKQTGFSNVRSVSVP